MDDSKKEGLSKEQLEKQQQQLKQQQQEEMERKEYPSTGQLANFMKPSQQQQEEEDHQEIANLPPVVLYQKPSNMVSNPGNQRQQSRGKKKIQWKEEVDIVIVENYKEYNLTTDSDKTSCHCITFQLAQVLPYSLVTAAA